MFTASESSFIITEGKSMLCRFLIRHGLSSSNGACGLRSMASGSISRGRALCTYAVRPETHKNSKPRSSPVKKGEQADNRADDVGFLAQDVPSFAALGIAPAVADALNNAGFSRPSTVQVRIQATTV
jgi:hypothetical protein